MKWNYTVDGQTEIYYLDYDIVRVQVCRITGQDFWTVNLSGRGDLGTEGRYTDLDEAKAAAEKFFAEWKESN